VSKLFSHKDTFFIEVEGVDIAVPLPGDLLIKKNEYARIVFSSKISNDKVLIKILGEENWCPGKQGVKVWVAELRAITLGKDNFSEYIVKRGGKTVSPFSFYRKIINFLIKMIIKAKRFFS
jgi:hypothetical protein